jgi:hypothetical protein
MADDMRLLDTVDAIARRAAQSDTYVDVYVLARQLCDEYRPLGLSNQLVVNTLIAAAIAYGAPILLDPSLGSLLAKA